MTKKGRRRGLGLVWSIFVTVIIFGLIAEAGSVRFLDFSIIDFLAFGSDLVADIFVAFGLLVGFVGLFALLTFTIREVFR